MRQLNDHETRSFLRALSKRDRARDRRRAAVTPIAGGFWDDWPLGAGGGFDAARRDRSTDDWNPGTIGPNRLHQMDARLLRERVRDLDRNNPKAAAALSAFLKNVVECGITPKSRQDDEDSRRSWGAAWDEWGGLTPVSDGECDTEGRRTIYELQAQVLREVIVGGGCLVHYVELPIGRDRKHPLAIELIPEERIADDQDTWQIGTTNTETGGQIVRGIEIDPRTGRHLAYWVKPTQVNDVVAEPLQPIRIPAARCKYLTLATLTGQVRGFSLLAPVVLWLYRLGYYCDAEMQASNMKANWGFMVLTDEESPDEVSTLNDDEGAELTDAYGNRLERVSPGMIWRGKPGDDIKAIGPNVPQADSIPWLQLIQQSIAQGVDLSEIELTRDYSRVTFSSARAAANRDRKTFRVLQQFIVNHFCNPTWRRFVAGSVRALLPGFPTPSTYASDPGEWLRVKWRAPGWPSVNPVDDAMAQRTKLQDGTTTREKIVAGEGDDWEEVADQWELENARLGMAGDPAKAAKQTDPETGEPLPDNGTLP